MKKTFIILLLCLMSAFAVRAQSDAHIITRAEKEYNYRHPKHLTEEDKITFRKPWVRSGPHQLNIEFHACNMAVYDKANKRFIPDTVDAAYCWDPQTIIIALNGVPLNLKYPNNLRDDITIELTAQYDDVLTIYCPGRPKESLPAAFRYKFDGGTGIGCNCDTLVSKLGGEINFKKLQLMY